MFFNKKRKYKIRFKKKYEWIPNTFDSYTMIKESAILSKLKTLQATYDFEIVKMNSDWSDRVTIAIKCKKEDSIHIQFYPFTKVVLIA